MGYMPKLIQPEQIPHLGGFAMLPAEKGACEQCGVKHEPELPHNLQSLMYQYRFYGEHGRWPTWDDAMAHCTGKMKAAWTQTLGDVMSEREAAPSEKS